MLYPGLVDIYTGGEFPIAALQIYNETKYASLGNLDYRGDLGTFPHKAHSASVNTLSLDPIYNNFLVSGSSDSSIKLWDLQKTEVHNIDGESYLKYEPVVTLPRKSVHDYGVTKVKWWPDNGMVLSSSYDFKVNVIDAELMSVAHTFKLNARVIDFDFSPKGDSTMVAACLDDGIGVKLLDLRTVADVQKLGGEEGARMSTAAWSPINSNICVGGGVDGSCYGWDIRSSEKHLFELDSNLTSSKSHAGSRLKGKAHHGRVNSMIFNSEGTELITLGHDNKIKVWDLCTHSKPFNKLLNFGPLIRNKVNQRIDMCLSPALETEISFLWVPSDTGEVLVYRAEDGSLVARLNRSGRANLQTRSFSIACSGGNQTRYYSGCKDGTISVWGYETKQEPDVTYFDNGVDLVIEDS